jgi:hypothetical protein
VGAQEFDIAHLDRPQPADRANDARHDDGAVGAPAHRRRVVEIDPREGGHKAVRIAFAVDLAVGDDVDAGSLHVADRQPGRIVLGGFEPGLGQAPQLAGAHSHRRRERGLAIEAGKAGGSKKAAPPRAYPA